MAWPPATYDVISRTHSNWPSLNLSQNAREEINEHPKKTQALMFHRLRKIIRKTLGGGNHLPSPSLYVQGLKEKTYPEYQESVFPIMKTAKKNES